MTATWTLIPTELPSVTRRCPRCDEARPFRCSEKFRVNANKKRVDVWLIYRCDRCDATWNRSIARRATALELGDDYERFCRNDRSLARQHAFAELPANDRRVPFRIETSSATLPARIRLSAPVSVRLDRVLAQVLGVSRSSLRKRFDAAALRRTVTDGQTIAPDYDDEVRGP